jgi:hypothetical protein
MQQATRPIRPVLVILIVAAVVVAATAAVGQTASGTLSGTVIDAQGGVLPGVTIVVVYAPTGARSETVTGVDGRYTVAGLRPGGPYIVTASLPGFRDARGRSRLRPE